AAAPEPGATAREGTPARLRPCRGQGGAGPRAHAPPWMHRVQRCAAPTPDPNATTSGGSALAYAAAGVRAAPPELREAATARPAARASKTRCRRPEWAGA